MEKIDFKKPFIIAGPCALESKGIAATTAAEIENITKKYGIQIIFKSSFDKANRTKVDSYRGPGLDGLKIFDYVKSYHDIPCTTDIHEPFQADIVANYVDLIQIPAFLSRQTDLLKSAAMTGLPVSFKRVSSCQLGMPFLLWRSSKRSEQRMLSL